MHQPTKTRTAPRSPACRGTRLREWDAHRAVRDATAGALQALGVMLAFVAFGLGWALLAGANGTPTSAPSARALDPQFASGYRAFDVRFESQARSPDGLE